MTEENKWKEVSKDIQTYQTKLKITLLMKT